MKLEIFGEGDSRKTKITLNGGQWPDAEVRHIGDGIEITIIGGFEAFELAVFLKRAIANHEESEWVRFEGDAL